MNKLIYKKKWEVFGVGRGLFEAIPQGDARHSCAYCAFVHSKCCGKYSCKAEDREDKEDVTFDKL